MTPFERRPAPPFWAEKEALWASRSAEWLALDPLGWKHLGHSLRQWFHDSCRDPSEPALCAHCDGDLDVTSRKTVDHHAPRKRFQELSLAWHNLMPCCDLCNETYKGEQWSCALVRPDRDPVDVWFDVNLDSGALRPSPEIHDNPVLRARVRLTIKVFRLNTAGRCKARRDVVRALRNAWKRDARNQEHDRFTVAERVAQGPYRIVAQRFLEAVPSSTPAP